MLAAAAGLRTERAHACTIGPVSSDGGESAWIARVLPLYLEHYCLSVLPPEEGSALAEVTSSVSVSGGEASVRMELSLPDGRQVEVSLEGPPGEAAAWLAGAGDLLAREGALPRGSSLPSSPPATDSEALRLFAESLAAPDTAFRLGKLEEAVGKDESFLGARWLLAMDRYNRGEYETAAAGFALAAGSRPDLPAPLLNEGLSLMRAGRTGEGKERLDAAAGLRPASVPVALFRGRSLAAAGFAEEAEGVYRDILRAHPAAEEVLFERAVVAARLRGAGAAHPLFEGLTEDALIRAGEFLHLAGQKAFGSGELETAKAAFGAALEVDPGDNASRLALAVVRYALGEYEGAVEDLSAAARETGGDPDVYRYLGLSYEKLGNTEAAMESFRRSAEFLARQEGGSRAKGLFFASLAESRTGDSYPPPLPAPYLSPLADFWTAEEGPEPEPAAVDPVPETASVDPAEPLPAAVEAPRVEVPEAESQLQQEEQAIRLAQEALAAQKALREVQEENKRLLAEIENLRRAGAELERTVLERDEALLSLEVTLGEYRGQLEELQEAGAGKQAITAEGDEKERLVEELREEIAGLNKTAAEGAGELAALTKEIAAERKRAEDLESRLAAREKEAAARAEDAGDLGGRVEALEEENRNLAGLLAGYRSDAAAWEKREGDLKEEQREAQGRLSSLEREIGRLEQKLEAGSQAVREAEKSSERQAGIAAQLEEEARRSNAERESLAGELREAGERISRLEDDVRKSEKKLSRAEKERAEAVERAESLKTDLDRSSKAGEGLQEKVIELEEALSDVEKREGRALKDLDRLDKKFEEAAGRAASLEKELKEIEDRLRETEKREAEASKEAKSLAKKLDKEARKEGGLEEELEAARAEIRQLRDAVKEGGGLKKKVGSLEGELEKLRKKLEAGQAEAAGVKERLAEAEAAGREAERLAREAEELGETARRQRERLESLEAENARLRSLTDRMAEKLRESAAAKHGTAP